MNDSTYPARSSSRRLHLDALRGLAVLLMIEQHLGVWLWRGPLRGETLADYPWLVGINVLGGGAAPLFVTLAGAGVTLLARQRPDCGGVLVRRGVMVLAFGFALSLATPSWFTPRSWFVLHLIGVMIVAAAGLRHLSTRHLLLLAALVLAVTVVGQSWLDTPVPMSNRRMGGVLLVDGERARLAGGIVRLAAFEGHFPVFPWACFFTVGMVAARWLADGQAGKLVRYGVGMGAAGGVLAGLGAISSVRKALRTAGDLDGAAGVVASALDRVVAFNVPFYPASPAFVLLLAGVVLCSIAVGDRWERRRSISTTTPLVSMGRASLTLLIAHVVLVREGAHATGIWCTLTATQVGGVLIGVLVFAAVATRAWARRGYAYGAEWLLRRVA
ncbi:MAG: DUF418 domain-containing transporter [Myxococcales bacterium FL481]|nr:MAG: DUF418 domain-containing transporter [Myxococcales bacterium FL481]